MSQSPARAPAADPPPTDRVRVRRKPDRGHYDRATIDAILDRAVIGHVGYLVDGQPYVTPTAIWRQGDRLYWHGSAASRMLRTTGDGMPVCVTATLIDALVLTRSGFNHSIDYRSVMVLGNAHRVDDEAELEGALRTFVEHLYPGRWEGLRPPTRQELKATDVLWVDLSEASAKIRDVGAHDDPEDEGWPAWAGTIPVRTTFAAPRPDPFVTDAIRAPAVSPTLFGGPHPQR